MRQGVFLTCGIKLKSRMSVETESKEFDKVIIGREGGHIPVEWRMKKEDTENLSMMAREECMKGRRELGNEGEQEALER